MKLLRPTAIRGQQSSPFNPKYRPDIDGLRAVAVLVVLGYHAFPRLVPFGFVGVDIFFVISGFLISTVIMEKMAGNGFSYYDFYSRRIKRIFPALTAMLAAVLAFGWISLLPLEFKSLAKHVLGGATFISNFLLWDESGYFDASAAAKPLLHLWSLGIEEQYYVFWPLILSVACRKKESLPFVIVSIGIASFVFGLYELRVDPVAAFYSPASRVWELMIGSAIAYITSVNTLKRQSTSSSVGPILSAAGAILLLGGFCLISDARSFPGWWASLPTLGSALLIMGGAQSWVNRRFLSRPWIVFIGKISFPLYLWHWPLLSFAQILYAGSPSPAVKASLLLTACALASITYTFIERPIRYSEPMPRTTILLVAVEASIALFGALVYLNDGLSSRSIVGSNPSLLQKAKFSSNLASQCTKADEVISRNKLCTIYLAEPSVKTILLWGDSSTQAWLPVFLDIGKDLGYTIINLSHPSCPPIVAARKTKFDYRESREYCEDGKMQTTALQFISSMHPDVTVVIANWNSYSGPAQKEFVTDKPDGVADSASTKRTLNARLPETLEKLSQISRTIVFRSWPVMPATRGKTIARTLGLPWNRPIDTTMAQAAEPLIEFKKKSYAINLIFDHLHIPRITFFDPSTKICAGDICHSQVNGVNYYSDDYHISEAGAMSFRGDVKVLLNQALQPASSQIPNGASFSKQSVAY